MVESSHIPPLISSFASNSGTASTWSPCTYQRHIWPRTLGRKTPMVWDLEASDSSTLASTNHKHCLEIEKLYMSLFDREDISPPPLFFVAFPTRIQLYRTLPCLTHGIPRLHVFLPYLSGLSEFSISPTLEPCPDISSARLHLDRLWHDSHF